MAWRVTVTGDGADWLTLDPASGDGNGKVTVTLAVNAVPTGSTRTATVTFTAGTLTQTVTVTQAVIPTTLCELCLWSGSTWVNGYITSTFYPYDDVSTHTSAKWSGNGDTYYEGAASSVNGRANTAAIPSTAGSIVQRCKDLGAGWYLPAYEEYFNMGQATPDNGNPMENNSPLNGKEGASLVNDPWAVHYSSTEYYNNGGRYTSSDGGDKNKMVLVGPTGSVLPGEKGWDGNARCAWQPE
jgi:hypothetical protein